MTMVVEPESEEKNNGEESESSSVSVISPLLPGPDMPPSYSRLISLTQPPPYQDAIKVDTLDQILTSARETQLL